MELHGVVSGQRHAQTLVKELSQRVLRVLQEQAVVAEGGHGDGDLGQVIQVLKDGALRTIKHTRTRSIQSISFLSQPTKISVGSNYVM